MNAIGRVQSKDVTLTLHATFDEYQNNEFHLLPFQSVNFNWNNSK